jgi:peptide chain release factor 1
MNPDKPTDELLELIEGMARRFRDIEQSMSDPVTVRDARRMRALGREHRHLSETLALGEQYRVLIGEIADAEAIVDEDADPELTEMAQDDLVRLHSERKALAQRLEDALTPSDPNDARPAIVEIRAGTGGEEAALFAADLMRMYTRFVERKGWRIEMLGSSETGVGGFKEVAFAVNGDGAYGTLKFESGVHRVQRVPVTEAAGRLPPPWRCSPKPTKSKSRFAPRTCALMSFVPAGPAGSRSIRPTRPCVSPIFRLEPSSPVRMKSRN